jgi:cytochrome P450
LLVAEIKAAQAQEYPISRGFLVADGLGDIFAGTDTTSTTLTMTIREIFKDPAIYTRLHEELKTVLPSVMTIPALVELEKLPFLSACVKVRSYNSTTVQHNM